MLRRKSSCFWLILLVIYGVLGDSVGGEPDWNNTSVTVTTAVNLPTTENATTAYHEMIEEPVHNVAEGNVTYKKPSNSEPTIWSVHDAETNTTCIILRLEAEIFVPYVNTTGQDATANLTIPKEAYASGSCSGELNTTQYILLSWGSSQPPILPNHTLRLEFTKNVSEGADYVFTLTSVSFLVQPDSVYFPNISSVDSIEAYNHSLNLHPTHANNSYRCNSVEAIDLPLNNSLRLAQVKLRNMQVEAFRSQPDNEFSRAVDCPGDAVLNSDIVPIAVGCALAALVVVVLVAYLIGRRRARQRGYQSV